MSQIKEFLKRKPYLNITVSSGVEAKFKEMFPEVPYNVDDDFVRCVTTSNLKKVGYLRDWQGVRTHYPDVWGYVPFMYDYNQFLQACADCSRSNFMQQNFLNLREPYHISGIAEWGMVLWVSISEARNYFNKYNLTRSPSIQIKADSMTVVKALAATSDYFLEWDVTFLNTVALDAWDAIYELYGTDMLLSRGVESRWSCKLAFMRELLKIKKDYLSSEDSCFQLRQPLAILPTIQALGIATECKRIDFERCPYNVDVSALLYDELSDRPFNYFVLSFGFDGNESSVDVFGANSEFSHSLKIEQFNIIRPSKKVDMPLTHEDYVCLLFALLYQTPRKSKYGWCYVVNHRNVYLNEIS